MKIVYCILGTYNSGGMERVLANKANYLVAKGHEVCIVTTDQLGRKPYFELNPHIKQYDLGVNYKSNNGKGLLSKLLCYPGKQWKHRRKLSCLLKILKADIVISMFDNDVSFLHKIADGSKKILEIHFSGYKRLQYGRSGLWKWIDRIRNRQDRAIVKSYDHFVVLTEEDRSYWGTLPNICVIPNANGFEPQVRADLDARRVIAVGRYDYQKGFDDLIQTWSTIYTYYPEWVLDIYGHGPLSGELTALIERLGLQHVVSLCAPVKDIELEYASSAVLAMTSRYEGLPMVLLEAQACGLPLVSYACKCGPRDIISDGKNGYLIAPGDQETLGKQLMRLMGDENLRKQMGNEALRLSRRFSTETVMQKWLNLFNEV